MVVLADGDLTATEAENEQKIQDEAAPPPGTKIVFKKPVKRKEPSGSDKDADSSSGVSKPKKSKKKEKKLLSFTEDDEEDGDSTWKKI